MLMRQSSFLPHQKIEKPLRIRKSVKAAAANFNRFSFFFLFLFWVHNLAAEKSSGISNISFEMLWWTEKKEIEFDAVKEILNNDIVYQFTFAFWRCFLQYCY
ncbi:CLUMA_CG017088, isoform A [Clunio marinus]|uniref:CLUMA_CG017088, isoform A n=1 Tax=Clunio marinus TaxID=568069 RepID=A0A1J1IUV9_9DIPT|nr:CLUMA_CG017088, isoform A [Clunio marinus]